MTYFDILFSKYVQKLIEIKTNMRTVLVVLMDKSKRFVSLVILVLLLSSLFGLVFYLDLISFNNYPIQILYIERSKSAVFKTSPKFLSITLDDDVIAKRFNGFDMRSKKLIKMLQYLSPGYFRVGGNLGEKLSFLPNENSNYSYTSFKEDDFPNITLTASDWLKLTNLSYNANMDLFFGLNSLNRFKNGSWNFTNAELMIKFSSENKLNVNWELGNEPNLFRHKFNEEVNATQMATDFHTLRNILNNYEFYKNSLLVGPDVTRPEDNNKASEKYLKTFVKNAKDSINKITWHQYYMNGRLAQPKDFLDPNIYNLLKFQINKVKEITNSSGKPIWLGETASAYGGGAPNMSDRFIGTFIWLDKLGLAAKMGIEVVMRQSIFNGNYSLLDKNYDPNPDWWVSLLHKKLVGSTVVPYHTVTSDKVRLYVHCFRNKSKSIIVFGINVDKNPVQIKIEGLTTPKTEKSKLPLYIYSFELQTNDLFSKNVYLNGVLLKMLQESKLPQMLPKKIKCSPYILMPSLSLVFWVIPNANIKACS